MAFHTWWLAALSALLFAVIVYPILALAEKVPGFSALMTERGSGEMKNSLMLALVAAFCWGCVGERMLELCSIYAWGSAS